MAILLDHVIVPSRSPVTSAQVLAEILGIAWEAEVGHFTPVYVNETLTLDFDEAKRFESHHYCFHVSDEEFDGIFERVRSAGIKYRSTPNGADDLHLNTRMGGAKFLLERRRWACLGGADGQLRPPRRMRHLR